MTGNYATTTGVSGVCNGFLVGNVAQMFCYNTTPSCYGDYQGPVYATMAQRGARHPAPIPTSTDCAKFVCSRAPARRNHGAQL